MCKTPRLLCSPWLLSQPFAPWLVKTSQSLGAERLSCAAAIAAGVWMGEITCSFLLAKYLLSTSKAILSARQANYQICLIWKRQNTFKLPARLRIKRQVPSLRRKMLVRGIVSPLPWSIGMCRRYAPLILSRHALLPEPTEPRYKPPFM